MIVTTKNSVYTLKDKGDGVFELTSTNPRYAGPLEVVLLNNPKIGIGFVALRVHPIPGRGAAFQTSPVVEVQEE